MKWVILAFLFVLNVMNYADKSIIGVAAAPMMKDLGLNYEQWGIVGSSFYWLFFIATVIGGALSDRFGPKKVLTYMALIWSVAQVIPFFASSLALLIFARFILGIGEGPFTTVAINQLNRWFPQEQRGFATAINNMGASLGKSLFIPVLVFLVVAYGWRVSFLITAAISLLWMIFWIFVGKDSPDSQPAVKAPEVVKEKSAREKFQWRTYAAALKHPSFLFSSLAVFAVHWAVSFGVVFLPNYLTEVRGFTPAVMGTVMAIGGLSGAIVAVLLAGVADRLFKKTDSYRLSRTLFSGIGLVIAGIGFYLITIGQSPLMIILGYGIYTACASPAVALTPQVVMRVMPEKPGTIIGFSMAISALAGVIGPIVSGNIIQAGGGVTGEGFSQAFLLTSLICVVAGLLLAIFTKPDLPMSSAIIESHSQAIEGK
ncbi:MFS transporter [Brevibacillus choshinensis]|uniref:MFS transporter n=1 Tax=Brevibacillus choshinensis TaxID=54911 RepID=UPI002E20983D|nr:MFS transporter [Brevibacillus choshinensis]